MKTLRPTLIQAIAKLPAPLDNLMRELCLAENFDASLSEEQFAVLLEKTGLTSPQLKLSLLPVAAAYAIVPISNFYVGAIAEGGSGRVYFGANMEFASLGLNNSIHGEQSVITHAWAKGEEYIKNITINYSPCGHCRQFMNELNQVDELSIQLPNQKTQKLSHYLPYAFGPKDLNVEQGLLSKQNHGLVKKGENDLTNAAIEALNQSYAPYSQNFCAVALKDSQGQIYSGNYAENAAFNPSLSPLHMALNLMNLANVDFSLLTEAVLVEMHEAKISLLSDTKALLSTIKPTIQLQHKVLKKTVLS